MKNKFLPPIHIACSNDEMALPMQHVEILDGIATATNGYVVVRLNLSVYSSLDDNVLKKLSGKYIHRDVWKMIHSAENIFLNEENESSLIFIDGGVDAEVTIKDSSEITFPNYQSLVDRITNSKYEKKSFISFNPEWVSIAKKIFCSENLIMRFYESEGMFTLFPSGDAKAFMGIMPSIVDEQDANVNFSLV